MINTKAMPALLPAHHRLSPRPPARNDFADPLDAYLTKPENPAMPEWM